MVDADESVVADIFVGLKHLHHVGWSIVGEGLMEIIQRASDVAEMDEMNALIEMANRLLDIDAEFEETALAKRQSI